MRSNAFSVQCELEPDERARSNRRAGDGAARSCASWMAAVLAIFSSTSFSMADDMGQIFSDRYLDVAQALQAHDFGRVRQLAQGLPLDVPGNKQTTLLWFVTANKNFPAVSVLIALGSQPDEQVIQGLGSPLNAAFESRELQLLTAMLDGGLSPNHTHPRENLMLQRAVTSGTPAHVQLLLDRGADVNQRDGIGGTALTEAISTARPDVALYLVERGADVNLPMTNGVTPAWGVQRALARQPPGSELAVKFERLRDAMAKHGARFPATPPAQMRQQMKAQGLPVAE